MVIYIHISLVWYSPNHNAEFDGSVSESRNDSQTKPPKPLVTKRISVDHILWLWVFIYCQDMKCHNHKYIPFICIKKATALCEHLWKWKLYILQWSQPKTPIWQTIDLRICASSQMASLFDRIGCVGRHISSIVFIFIQHISMVSCQRSLPAMLTHGRWDPFGRIPSICGNECTRGRGQLFWILVYIWNWDWWL